MKRWAAVLVATVPLWLVVSAAPFNPGLLTQCCSLQSLFAAASFTYDVSFSGSAGTQQQREAFVANVQAGATRWNDEFQSRNQAVSIAPTTTSPTLVVRVDDNYIGATPTTIPRGLMRTVTTAMRTSTPAPSTHIHTVALPSCRGHNGLITTATASMMPIRRRSSVRKRPS